jgi:hypothetical protein
LVAHLNDNAKQQREELEHLRTLVGELRKEHTREHTRAETLLSEVAAGEAREVELRAAAGSHASTSHEDFADFLRQSSASAERTAARLRAVQEEAKRDLESVRAMLSQERLVVHELNGAVGDVLATCHTRGLLAELSRRLPILISDPARIALLHQTFEELDRICAIAVANTAPPCAPLEIPGDLVQTIVGSPGMLPQEERERIYRRFRAHFAVQFNKLGPMIAADFKERIGEAEPKAGTRPGTPDDARPVHVIKEEGDTTAGAVGSLDGLGALRLEDTGNSNPWERTVMLVIERRSLVKDGPEKGHEVTTWTRFHMDAVRVDAAIWLLRQWKRDVHAAAVAFKSPEAAT